MTLEDFFTLTEMKDGLTALARVEELVAEMQKEKECVVKNVGDTTRQWSAVASTLAATESKDCLDLFIQLGGLCFIDRWLKDAQKFSSSTSDSFAEESISVMLRALEKLHLDNEKSISSGIWITVKNLLGHNSSRIQDRARVLFDSWKQNGIDGAILQDVGKVASSHDDGTTVCPKLAGEVNKPECSSLDGPLSENIVNDENCAPEPVRDDMLPSRTSGGLQPENVHDVFIQSHNDKISSPIILNRGGIEDCFSDPKLSSHVPSSLEENPIKEPPLVHTLEGIGSETCSSVPEQGSALHLNVSNLNEFTEDAKQSHKVNSFSEKSGDTEFSLASSSLEPGAVHTSLGAAKAQECMTDPGLQNNDDDNKGDVCEKSETVTPEPKIGIDNVRDWDYCRAREFKIKDQNGDYYTNVLQESSGNDCISGKHEDPETSLSRKEDTGAADEDKEQASDGGEDLKYAPDFSKPPKDVKIPDLIDNRRSDMELDYGIVDALEVARQVARQVAQEVEREVVDYRERSCSSSSEKISGGGIRLPGSPDSINGRADLPIKGPPNELPSRKNLIVESNLDGEEHSIKADNPEQESENFIRAKDPSQLTAAALESEMDTQKGLCDFDLNQEVCSDDMDNQVNPVSTLISVVSVSRPAAAPGLPVAPLQFEGALEWKGSAETSAFRPASPRRIPDTDKAALIGGIDNSAKKRQDFLTFDLNVAEEVEDKLADPVSGKQIPASSELLSGESSVEVSPRKSERLKLDLNRIDDDGDDGDPPPSDFQLERRIFFPQNGHRSPSPASSTSSMQPSMRNIDLNDRPFLHNDFLDQGSYSGRSSQNVRSYGGLKTDDPVFSIMGTKVDFNRRDLVPRTLSLANGKPPESGMDANTARAAGAVLGMNPTMSYTHSPLFGYNGLTTGPAVSFSSAVYGPGGSIPYMVDSRGAPVVPQIIGSASAVSHYPQPFIMNVTGAPPTLNGTGLSHPNFDLNTGFAIGGGNREFGGLRQLFSPGQSMEEHLRANSHPSSSSGVGGKRKEPEGGWETYPFNYKQQPPWK